MRRLKKTLIGAIALGAIGIAFGVIHHARGARLEVAVTPHVSLSAADCQAEVRRYGGGAGVGQCPDGEGRAWYRVDVRNTGHRGAWVSGCSATGRDRLGRIVAGANTFDVPIWLTSPGIGARPYLDPGSSASLTWFAPVRGPIHHYEAACSLIVYSTVPI